MTEKVNFPDEFIRKCIRRYFSYHQYTIKIKDEFLYGLEYELHPDVKNWLKLNIQEIEVHSINRMDYYPVWKCWFGYLYIGDEDLAVKIYEQFGERMTDKPDYDILYELVDRASPLLRLGGSYFVMLDEKHREQKYGELCMTDEVRDWLHTAGYKKPRVDKKGVTTYTRNGFMWYEWKGCVAMNNKSKAAQFKMLFG